MERDSLLDTGCSRTPVHNKLIPKEKDLEGEVVAIRCYHGDIVLYSLAYYVTVDLDGQPLEVEVAESGTLPVSMLLGTDVPELKSLLERELGVSIDGETQQKVADVLAVKKAQAEAQHEEEVYLKERELQSGVHAKVTIRGGGGGEGGKCTPRTICGVGRQDYSW